MKFKKAIITSAVIGSVAFTGCATNGPTRSLAPVDTGVSTNINRTFRSEPYSGRLTRGFNYDLENSNVRNSSGYTGRVTRNYANRSNTVGDMGMDRGLVNTTESSKPQTIINNYNTIPGAGSALGRNSAEAAHSRNSLAQTGTSGTVKSQINNSKGSLVNTDSTSTKKSASQGEKITKNSTTKGVNKTNKANTTEKKSATTLNKAAGTKNAGAAVNRSAVNKNAGTAVNRSAVNKNAGTAVNRSAVNRNTGIAANRSNLVNNTGTVNNRTLGTNANRAGRVPSNRSIRISNRAVRNDARANRYAVDNRANMGAVNTVNRGYRTTADNYNYGLGYERATDSYNYGLNYGRTADRDYNYDAADLGRTTTGNYGYAAGYGGNLMNRDYTGITGIAGRTALR